jgi:hypothetical protein
MSLASNLIPKFVEMCINPNEPSEAWTVFMNSLGSAIGRRPDCRDSFDAIINTLFPLALQEGPLQSACLERLSDLLQYNMSETMLRQLVARFRGQGVTLVFFKLLLNPVHVQPFANPTDAIELVSETVDFVIAEHNDRDTVYGFLLNICEANRIEIPEEKLPALFDLHKSCKLFWTFIKKMMGISAISVDFMTSFIQNYRLKSVTPDFFNSCTI